MRRFELMFFAGMALFQSLLVGQTALSVTPQTVGPNFATYSEDFTQSVWQAYFAGPTTRTFGTTDVLDPLGGSNATKFTFVSFGGYAQSGVVQAGTLVPGRAYTASIWLRGAAGGEQARFGFDDYNLTQAITLSTAWVRYDFYAPALTTQQARVFVLSILTPGSTLYAFGAQVNFGRPTTYIKTTGTIPTQFTALYALTANGVVLAQLDPSLQLDGSTPTPFIRARGTIFARLTVVGTLPTLTLSANIAAGTEPKVIRNGLSLYPTIDYTFAGAIITFLVVPQNGDRIQVESTPGP